MIKLKKAAYYVELVLICMVIWCVLKEEMTFKSIITGMIFGIFALSITVVYLVKQEYEHDYSFSISRLVIYFLLLIFKIIKAGILVIPFIIKGKADTGIIEIKTIVKKGIHSAIIANSITLTPGTVVIDKQGENIKVLQIDCEKNTGNEAQIIEPYEILLAKHRKKPLQEEI